MTDLNGFANVLNNFNILFPDAYNCEWSQEDCYYEVEFEQDGLEKEVIFDMEGNVLEFEEEIMIEELPEIIKDYLVTNYDGFEIEEAERVSIIYYEVELKKGDAAIELMFTGDGELVDAESDEEE